MDLQIGKLQIDSLQSEDYMKLFHFHQNQAFKFL